MADTLLNNTLTGVTPLPANQAAPAAQPAPTTPTIPPLPTGLTVPTQTGNTEADIRTLQGAQKPANLLMDFQKAMQSAASLAYKERQTSEIAGLGAQFDPTKVSGGTFAGILSNLEANRGADVSKVYASTVSAYASAQEQITSRLQFLQQLQESRRQFEEELKLKKKDLKRLKKSDEKAYKLEMKKLAQNQSQWEKEFSLAKYKAEKANETQSFDDKNGVDTSQEAEAGFSGGSNASFGTSNPYFTPSNYTPGPVNNGPNYTPLNYSPGPVNRNSGLNYTAINYSPGKP